MFVAVRTGKHTPVGLCVCTGIHVSRFGLKEGATGYNKRLTDKDTINDDMDGQGRLDRIEQTEPDGNGQRGVVARILT